MSSITSPIRSYITSEESYCSPWDLKIQEEKFKLLNEKHQIVQSSRKQCEQSPPILPPLPPGGLISSCYHHTEKLNPQTIQSSTDTSRSFLFALKSPLNKRSRKKELVNSRPHIRNSSLPKIQHAYDQPQEKLQTSLVHNLHRRSLQKIPNTKQHCLSQTFPIVSPCQHSNDTNNIPIDRYFWYHYSMSRRQAENILESRSSGSFLVRQSESGNQNDYSLSIKTIKDCMHMRICYSNGFYILGECSQPFSSISCMINYFSHTPVPIRGAAHIKLGTPVLRWEILSSSLSNEELL